MANREPPPPSLSSHVVVPVVSVIVLKVKTFAYTGNGCWSVSLSHVYMELVFSVPNFLWNCKVKILEKKVPLKKKQTKIQ